ncbi:MAG: hypothetical protein ACD_28C00161G0003 [uncultured bacterium]|nr:MAG: hypothetical protein ACD_28C00161G0003 [uncultured bacterium]KKT75032.1 MAG: hypothetical protein UW70_C0040G0007 [Candidatus Peregrinibacteria bacterium GW2011_GWA2_44_7]
MTTTSISVDKKIRDKAAAKAKNDMISLSAVVRILLIDYAEDKIRIGSQSNQEFTIQRIEVDNETQSLMEDVITEWNKSSL